MSKIFQEMLIRQSTNLGQTDAGDTKTYQIKIQ